MLTVDSSAILALLDSQEPHHAKVAAALLEDAGPYLIPAAVLGEVTYFLGTRLGAHVLQRFVDDLKSRAFAIDCGDEDLDRISELMGRYADLPLSFPDACVVACAERSGGRVLSLDRDFAVVAREGTVTVVP